MQEVTVMFNVPLLCRQKKKIIFLSQMNYELLEHLNTYFKLPFLS